VPYSRAKVYKWIRHDFITAESVLFEQQYFLNPEPYIFKKGKMLEFDTHLNNKGRIIIPSHYIFTKYMNHSNTFYITVDEFKYLNYIKDLSFIKINMHFKKFKFEEVENFATPILMSQMFKKGYLEEMFNIEGDEFHKELIRWHRKNVRLVNEYRKGKIMKKKGFLYRLFNDLYEVTLYFDTDTDTPSSEKYMLRHVSKLTNTYIKGIDEEGLNVEFKSVKPFDYKIKKYY
jgi:hypothetical protein